MFNLLPGMVAFYDPAKSVIAAVDLEKGYGWQKAVKPYWMAYSPDGSRLLVYRDNGSVNNALGSYAVISSEGVLRGQISSDLPVRWTEDGRLIVSMDSRQKIVVQAEDGTEAWIEQTPLIKGQKFISGLKRKLNQRSFPFAFLH